MDSESIKLVVKELVSRSTESLTPGTARIPEDKGNEIGVTSDDFVNILGSKNTYGKIQIVPVYGHNVIYLDDFLMRNADVDKGDVVDVSKISLNELSTLVLRPVEDKTVITSYKESVIRKGLKNRVFSKGDELISSSITNNREKIRNSFFDRRTKEESNKSESIVLKADYVEPNKGIVTKNTDINIRKKNKVSIIEILESKNTIRVANKPDLENKEENQEKIFERYGKNKFLNIYLTDNYLLIFSGRYYIEKEDRYYIENQYNTGGDCNA